MTVATEGNVYVVGWVSGELTGQTGGGGKDAFVRKYAPSGQELWTRQFGSSASEEALGVAVDEAGNVYLAGWSDGVLPGVSSSGKADALLFKYGPNGEELWQRRFGSEDGDVASGVAVDGIGNVYVVGRSDGALRDQENTGLTDVFISKYDPDGRRLWTQQFGSIFIDEAVGVAADGDGNAYMVGWASAALPDQVSFGNVDAFIRKYDAEGQELWTRQFGSDA